MPTATATTTTDLRKLTKKQRRHRDQLLQLARYKHISRLSNSEAALELGVAERTIYNWLAEPLYQEVLDSWRGELGEASQTQIAEAQATALDTLLDVMRDPRAAGMARVTAAKTIGEWSGFGTRLRDEGKDDRAETDRLMKLIELKRQEQAASLSGVDVHHWHHLVKQGGYLELPGGSNISEAGRELAEYVEASGVREEVAAELASADSAW